MKKRASILLATCFFFLHGLLYAATSVEKKVVAQDESSLELLSSNIGVNSTFRVLKNSKEGTEEFTILLNDFPQKVLLRNSEKQIVLNFAIEEGKHSLNSIVNSKEFSTEPVKFVAPLFFFTGQNTIINNPIINDGMNSSSSPLIDKQPVVSVEKKQKIIVDSNGLMAKFISLLANWKNNFRSQLKKIANIEFNFYKFVSSVKVLYSTPEIMKEIGIFSAYLTLGWIAEWYTRRAVKKKSNLLFSNLEKQNYDAELPRHTQSVMSNQEGKTYDQLIKKIGCQLYRDKKFKQLLYAFGRFMADCLPLLSFYSFSTIATVFFLPSSPTFGAYLSASINIYLTSSLALILTRSIVSHDIPSLRLITFSDNSASFVYKWMRKLIILIAIAFFGNECAHIYGFSDDLRTVWMKFCGLIAHLILLFILFQSHRSVTAALQDSSDGFVGIAKRFLAKIWLWLAVTLIIITWGLWAVGVEDGLQRIIYFIARTILFLVAAHLLLLVINALLAAFFDQPIPLIQKDLSNANQTIKDKIYSESENEYILRRQRIRMVLKYSSFFLIVLGDGLFLLDAWDFKIIDWLFHNPVGRHVCHAMGMIFFAIVGSFFTWEFINLTIINRLRNWQSSGDTVRAARLRTLLPMLKMLIFILIFLMLSLTVLRELGVDTTPLLAGASLIGVAIGFGSQKLIQDFVTGIFLLMENAIQVGDLISVAGVTGIVEYLSIRAVRIRAPDGSLNTIPFSSVTIVNNVNRGIANVLFKVALAHPVDVDKVKDIFVQIAKEMRQEPPFDHLILDNLDWWGVDTINGASVTVVAQLRTVDDARLKVQREFNLRLIEFLNREKIELDNPQSYIFKKSIVD